MEPVTKTASRALGTTSATAEPAARGAQPPGSDVRITVALIPKAADGLTRLQQLTNLSKTDITNRAISSYGFFDEHAKAGRELIIRDRNTGETTLVQFL